MKDFIEYCKNVIIDEVLEAANFTLKTLLAYVEEKQAERKMITA